MNTTKSPYEWNSLERRAYALYVENNYRNLDMDKVQNFACIYEQHEVTDIIMRHNIRDDSPTQTRKSNNIERRAGVAANEIDIVKIQTAIQTVAETVTTIGDIFEDILKECCDHLGNIYFSENISIVTPLNFVNCIPLLSQLKSLLVLILEGDYRTAGRVQMDFAKSTTILSQILSLLHLLTFNKSDALLAQRKYFQFVGWLLDNLPVIGHFKCVVHYISNDNLSAVKSFYSATRTTFFLAGAYWAAVRCISKDHMHFLKCFHPDSQIDLFLSTGYFGMKHNPVVGIFGAISSGIVFDAMMFPLYNHVSTDNVVRRRSIERTVPLSNTERIFDGFVRMISLPTIFGLFTLGSVAYIVVIAAEPSSSVADKVMQTAINEFNSEMFLI